MVSTADSKSSHVNPLFILYFLVWLFEVSSPIPISKSLFPRASLQSRSTSSVTYSGLDSTTTSLTFSSSLKIPKMISRAFLGTSSSFRKLPDTKIFTVVFSLISCLAIHFLKISTSSSASTFTRGESAT
ncbi:hypothetical protein DSECCO2_508910 [anaerobic digester metagenome]